MWDTQYTRCLCAERQVQCPGSRKHQLYRLEHDDAGALVLVPDGTEDRYAAIQSHRDSVDVNKILARYAAGEVDVLNKVQTFFADVTDIPTSRIEMINELRAGRAIFDGLDSRVRSAYGNSYEKFLFAMDSPSFMEDFQKIVQAEPEPSPAPAAPAPAAPAAAPGGDN